MIASSFFIALFGWTEANLFMLKWAAGIAAFFANAVVVGLYALIVATYPAHLRAGGVGLVIGLGRGGAALGPTLGGALFSLGFDRSGRSDFLGRWIAARGFGFAATPPSFSSNEIARSASCKVPW